MTSFSLIVVSEVLGVELTTVLSSSSSKTSRSVFSTADAMMSCTLSKTPRNAPVRADESNSMSFNSSSGEAVVVVVVVLVVDGLDLGREE